MPERAHGPHSVSTGAPSPGRCSGKAVEPGGPGGGHAAPAELLAVGEFQPQFQPQPRL